MHFSICLWFLYVYANQYMQMQNYMHMLLMTLLIYLNFICIICNVTTPVSTISNHWNRVYTYYFDNISYNIHHLTYKKL